jgi:hypothetical protein
MPVDEEVFDRSVPRKSAFLGYWDGQAIVQEEPTRKAYVALSRQKARQAARPSWTVVIAGIAALLAIAAAGWWYLRRQQPAHA